jgi:hypothetical protein
VHSTTLTLTALYDNYMSPMDLAKKLKRTIKNYQT